MSQSTVIIAALLGLFVLYVAARGRLGTYVGAFLGQKPAATGGGGPSTGDVAKTALDVAKVTAMFA